MKRSKKYTKWYLLCSLMLCILLIPNPFGMMVFAQSGEQPQEEQVLQVYESAEDDETIAQLDDNGMSNDELMDGYVQKLIDESSGLPKKNLLRSSRSAGSDLSGIDRAAYEILREKIAKIAAGEGADGQNSISTEIEITASELEEKGIDCGPWTAEDLGVSSLVVDGKINAEATNAVSNLVRFNSGKVLHALLAGCPCELYWFDKNIGTNYQSFGYRVTGYGDDLILSLSGDSVFSMYVSMNYSVDQNQGTFLFDTAKVDTVKAAIQNARSIVAKHTGEGDVDRLAAYKNEICDWVSYNYEAADNDPPYGDPWQLIWVFDENPDTNVVCEGYSKAFQYLCDLSDFDSYIYCYSVSGTMTGGTGEGPHMWNIVHMGNGLNYLADITNCDVDTIGEGDGLFLRGSGNGSPQTGYTFDLSGNSISYVYGEDTKNIYTEDDLTLSSEEVFEGDYQNQMNKIAGHSLLLASEIGVCFRVSFSNGYNPSNCVMNFELSDGRTQSVPIAEAEKIPVNEERSDYRFTCYINPLELADTITATVSDGNTKILTDQYSAMNYIDYVQNNMTNNSALVNLVDALQNYGHYMQKSGWTDGKDPHEIILANQKIGEDTRTAVQADVSEMQIKKNLNNTGISDVKFSLLLNESTVIRVSAKPEDETSIKSAIVVPENGTAVSLSCNKTRMIEDKEYYQFNSEKIGAANLGKNYTFKVTTDQGTAEITASAMSYVDAVLKSSLSMEKKNAMTAYYKYYDAADKYTKLLIN